MARELNDIDRKIIELYKTGLTTSEIGKVVGKTKNSVCGLLSRYREWGDLDSKKYNTTIVIGKTKTSKKLSAPRSLFPKVKKSIPLPPPVPPVTSGIKFWKLNNKSCRYVINDGRPENFLFCGEPIHNRSYCHYHSSICYTVPERKKIAIEKRKW